MNMQFFRITFKYFLSKVSVSIFVLVAVCVELIAIIHSIIQSIFNVAACLALPLQV